MSIPLKKTPSSDSISLSDDDQVSSPNKSKSPTKGPRKTRSDPSLKSPSKEKSLESISVSKSLEERSLENAATQKSLNQSQATPKSSPKSKNQASGTSKSSKGVKRTSSKDKILKGVNPGSTVENPALSLALPKTPPPSVTAPSLVDGLDYSYESPLRQTPSAQQLRWPRQTPPPSENTSVSEFEITSKTWMLAGVAGLIIGFILFYSMSGSNDPPKRAKR